MDKTRFKLSQLAVKQEFVGSSVNGILQDAKAILWSVFLRVLFTSLVSSQGLPPPQFTLIANHNQFGLIEFYENFHLEWPLHESKFISKQRSQDQKQSLILRSSQRESPEDTNLCLQLACLVVPARVSEVAEWALIM